MRAEINHLREKLKKGGEVEIDESESESDSDTRRPKKAEVGYECSIQMKVAAVMKVSPRIPMRAQ